MVGHVYQEHVRGQHRRPDLHTGGRQGLGSRTQTQRRLPSNCPAFLREMSTKSGTQRRAVWHAELCSQACASSLRADLGTGPRQGVGRAWHAAIGAPSARRHSCCQRTSSRAHSVQSGAGQELDRTPAELWPGVCVPPPAVRPRVLNVLWRRGVAAARAAAQQHRQPLVGQRARMCELWHAWCGAWPAVLCIGFDMF